ncbi:MAG: DUF4258 domain-containing protein [Nitrospirae bacterium]|nr:DUF4258 domain-containing protein [Nitrospirota bacterium]
MFDRILKVMRDKIRKRQYIMTIHAEEEMDNECLTIYDIERCILTGKITERQKDRITAEWKYRINGKTIAGGEVEVITKISPTGKLVIITVYVP